MVFFSSFKDKFFFKSADSRACLRAATACLTVESDCIRTTLGQSAQLKETSLGVQLKRASVNSMCRLKKQRCTQSVDKSRLLPEQEKMSTSLREAYCGKDCACR